MSKCRSMKSPALASSPQIKWLNVTHVTENTCLAACSIEEMSYLRMSMGPSPPSRPRDPFNSWIGVPRDSKLESTTNHQLLFLVEIWPRYSVLYVCSPTQLPSPKLGHVWITSLI